jgi:hypothetical protein
MMLLFAGAGCTPQPPKEKPAAENIRLGDLAPKNSPSRQARISTAATIEIHTFDLPAENVGRLDDLWEALSTKSIWMTNYNSFRQNSFRVRSGRIEAWQKILDFLTKAGAQKVGVATLTVNDKDPTDWPIANSPPMISFVDEAALRQKINVGLGQLALRLQTEPVPGVRGVRKLIAYPVHAIPMSSAIPKLQAKIKEGEFIFNSVAFAAQMSLGDLLVLAPGEYTGERLTLGGLFFNKAEPVAFRDPAARQLPKRGPAVRVWVLVCAGVQD